MYEESFRMPFLVRYPQGIEPGQINTDITSNLDFAQTFLDYAGVEIDRSVVAKEGVGILFTSETVMSKVAHHPCLFLLLFQSVSRARFGRCSIEIRRRSAIGSGERQFALPEVCQTVAIPRSGAGKTPILLM